MPESKTKVSCDREQCDFFVEGRFCQSLDRIGVPQSQKWRTLILHLRGLAEFTHLSVQQKSALQELLVEILRDRDFSDERFEAVLRQEREIHVAPYEQRLRRALGETARLADDFRALLQRRKGAVQSLEEASVAAVMQSDDPEAVVQVLRNTFREMCDMLDHDTESINELVTSDFLTGIANRRAFDRQLQFGIEAWSTSGSGLALILFDIDHFKGFNDLYGHRIGDQALKTVASVLTLTVKKLSPYSDAIYPARYGGEEFAVLVTGNAAASAVDLAEDIREALERHIFSIRDCAGNVLRGDLSITVSGGVAEASALWPREFVADALVDSADKALYMAKASGRNAVCQWVAKDDIRVIERKSKASMLLATKDS